MGKKNLPTVTARLVLARSGGFCANPSCRADLFPPLPNGRVATVDTLAHIIGQSSSGPRGQNPMPLAARDDASNIILLCPTCHKLVDDVNAVDVFTEEVLLAWKREHERRVRHGAAIPRFSARAELDDAVRPLLRENQAISETLGPNSPAGDDLMGSGLDIWRAQVVEVIVPNNRRVLELIDANAQLLDPDELKLVEVFRLHAAAREFNYTSGRWRAGGPRFPVEFPKLFAP